MEAEHGHTLKMEDLIGRIRNSDTSAYTCLFDLFWEPMFSYAASIIMDTAIAKDLVQDVWVDYWQRRHDIEIYNIKAYLFKAVRYRCYNYMRDSKFNQTHREVADAVFIRPEVEQIQDMVDLSQRIHTTMESLPKRCQEVFKLSRVNDFSNKEIAKKLNISQRSVENQISLALRKLRKDLAMAKMLFY